MTIANDTFVEGSDTPVTSHTPTGADAGTSWSALIGSATVRGATDDLVDADGGASNALRMTNNLGVQHQVQIDMSFNAGVGAGALVFSGVMGRYSAAGLASYIFTYDWFTGKWILEDGVTSNELTEAYGTPTVVKTLKLDLLTNDQKAYVNGVLKCSLATDRNNTLENGGLKMGNFSGSAAQTVMDNYQSQTLPIASATRKFQRASVLGV